MAEQSEPKTASKASGTLMILGLVAALIAVLIWLTGRSKLKEQFSYDNLRKLFLDEERG